MKAESGSPVMAVLRVRAPASPSVLAATLTRGLGADPRRPITAELELVPAPRAGDPDRHTFVAVLCGARQTAPAKVVRRAQRAGRRALREAFGKEATVKARMPGPEELGACWWNFRGTPHRPGT